MAYEYTTTSLVQAELQSSTAFSSSTVPTDTQVTEWIQEESAYINSLAETTFSSTAVASEFVDYSGGLYIFPQYAPVISVSSVQYNNYKLGSTLGSSWVTKSSDVDYTLYDDIGVIRILDSWNPKAGLKRICLGYTYGYNTTPKEVQKLATMLVAQRVLDTLLSKKINEGDGGGTVEVGPIKIVEPGDYGITRFKQLNAGIEGLKKDIVDGFKVHRTGYHLFD